MVFYLCDEREGKRDCNEISTALYKYLIIVDQRKIIKDIDLYCDSCTGQNRNKAVLAMLNDRFFEKLFMAILFTVNIFARNLPRGNRRRNTFYILF